MKNIISDESNILTLTSICSAST